MVMYDRGKLTQELKKVAFRNNVDLIGVTDPRVFDDIPISERPMRILSDAKAVIVYAVKYKGARDLFEESWYSRMEKRLNRIDKRLREFLAEKGYKTHSFGTFDMLILSHIHDSIITEKGSPSEHLLAHQRRRRGVYYKLQDAAVSAGLGNIGKNRTLITPQYGPYVHLSMIITDAPLKPDKPFEENLCADCDLCIRVCPTGALTGRGHPDETKCKAWDCHFACLRVCHEKFLKQLHQSAEQQKTA